jgi:PIN domain nuclease of toxin-antitoxin system
VNLLVDTHALLWFVAGDERLSVKAREAIMAPDATVYVSIASWWEMAIKCSLRRLTLDDQLDVFMAQRVHEGFRILPIEMEHLPALVGLPFHHRDPFDRLIICQAMREDMPICTGDAAFDRYDVRIIW